MSTEGLLHQRLQIKAVKNKIKGNGSLVYTLVAMLLLSLCMFTSFMYLSIRDTAKGIENAIATSLLGASRINVSEYGTTNQVIIHEDLPEKYRDTLGKYAGSDIEMYIPNNTEYFPVHPEYSEEFAESYSNRDIMLDWSKNKFVELLKTNLDLDNNMVPSSSSANGKILKSSYYDEADGIDKENKVNIEEYTIINKYTYRESKAPYNKHTYTVVYRSSNGGAFTVVSGLSGIDKNTYISAGAAGWENVVDGGKCDGIEISSTSVYARISFYTDLGTDGKGNRQSKKQIVDRVVTVKEK